MKRFENKKLDDFIMEGLCRGLSEDVSYYGNLSEADIASYLCEELKIDVVYFTGSDTWLAANNTQGVECFNKSRNQAIFRVAEMILEEG